MSDYSIVSLWGDDHPHLGEVATTALDGSTAIALSRGRFPKPYHHVDPNEDAALAASGPGGRLLAVADGHHGFDAARAAMEALTESVPAALAPGADPQVVLRRCFESASGRVADAVGRARGAHRESRTALSIALIGDDEAWTATLGDTAVVRVRGDRGRVISDPEPFLGPDSSPPAVKSIAVKNSDALIAVTDGVVDHLGRDWADRLATSVANAATVLEAVDGIMELAWLGGAGDHVAIAAGTVARGSTPGAQGSQWSEAAHGHG